MKYICRLIDKNGQIKKIRKINAPNARSAWEDLQRYATEDFCVWRVSEVNSDIPHYLWDRLKGYNPDYDIAQG